MEHFAFALHLYAFVCVKVDGLKHLRKMKVLAVLFVITVFVAAINAQGNNGFERLLLMKMLQQGSQGGAGGVPGAGAAGAGAGAGNMFGMGRFGNLMTVQALNNGEFSFLNILPVWRCSVHSVLLRYKYSSILA